MRALFVHIGLHPGVFQAPRKNYLFIARVSGNVQGQPEGVWCSSGNSDSSVPESESCLRQTLRQTLTKNGEVGTDQPYTRAFSRYISYRAGGKETSNPRFFKSKISKNLASVSPCFLAHPVSFPFLGLPFSTTLVSSEENCGGPSFPGDFSGSAPLRPPNLMRCLGPKRKMVSCCAPSCLVPFLVLLSRQHHPVGSEPI